MPGGKLPRDESEIVILRVAHNTECEYEWRHHERLGAQAGLSAEEIERVKDGPDAGWSERRAALLRATDELHADRRISDAVWAELRPLYSDERADRALPSGRPLRDARDDPELARGRAGQAAPGQADAGDASGAEGRRRLMADEPPPDDDRITYAVFGERFFEHAVTEGRIVGALDGLAGDQIEFGPIGAGPGKLAKVRAEGTFGQASAERLPSEEVSFRLTIPVELDLDIELVDRHRFDVAVTVGLTLVARAAEPLRVVIDIDQPTAKDVNVVVEAEGIRASVLQRVGGIDREIGRFVARYIQPRAGEAAHRRRAGHRRRGANRRGLDAEDGTEALGGAEPDRVKKLRDEIGERLFELGELVRPPGADPLGDERAHRRDHCLAREPLPLVLRSCDERDEFDEPGSGPRPAARERRARRRRPRRGTCARERAPPGGSSGTCSEDRSAARRRAAFR